jgi:hypothetical protein
VRDLNPYNQRFEDRNRHCWLTRVEEARVRAARVRGGARCARDHERVHARVRDPRLSQPVLEESRSGTS